MRCERSPVRDDGHRMPATSTPDSGATERRVYPLESAEVLRQNRYGAVDPRAPSPWREQPNETYGLSI